MGTHPIFESDFDCLTEKDEYFSPRRRYEPLAGHIAANCEDFEVEVCCWPLWQITNSIHCRFPDSLFGSLLEFCFCLQYRHESGLHLMLRCNLLLHLPQIQSHSQS